jgi:uncharacterized protein (TIGR03382 family)
MSEVSTVERKLIAFTISLLATSSAHASHPLRTLQSDGTAHEREFVAAAAQPAGRGLRFARQVLPATGIAGDQRATSRTIYLNRAGAIVLPGDNDARADRSTIVGEPVFITPWDIDAEMWDDTVSCIRDMYARFDVTITDEDPGDVPHIEAIFGGHPNDVGLPDEVAGVSPFTNDCSVIENSVVFTFTDVLPDDAQLMCEIMAQEIAHSYGLDHQLTPEDPMTYLDYDGDREFQNEMASCGEFESRDCGINGSVCRDGQNSVAVLTSRLGRRDAEDQQASPEAPTTTTGPEVGGCAASGSGGPLGGVLVVGVLAMLLRRRSR